MLLWILLTFQPSNRYSDHHLKSGSTGYIFDLYFLKPNALLWYNAVNGFFFLFMYKGFEGFEEECDE